MSDVLLSAWEKTVRRNRHKFAVGECVTGRRVTFQELDDGASAWLLAQGIGASELGGQPVVYSTANGVGWLEIFLGLLKARAVIVPVDAAEPVAAQQKIAEAVHARFWWNGKELTPSAVTTRRRRDASICLIKLTSGTTGTPRALHFTAPQLLADTLQIARTMGIAARDLNYALIPFGHSYGLGNLTLPLLVQGVPLICGTSPLPHAVAADFEKWQPTVFPGVPAMWRALSTADVALKSLRLGISAGSALPPSVAREFHARHGVRLHNFYGSSETGGITYDKTGDATLRGGVGRALHDVKLRIIEPAHLEASSAAVFTHRNRRSRGKRHGRWRMSDLVQMNSRGEVTLLGRRGQTVKISGRRVNLTDVVTRLRAISGVADAWAGISQEGEPVLGAVVATTLSVPNLRAVLHPDTAPWKIPKKWIVVSSLPLTARGKPDTRAMQDMIGQ